MGTPIHSAFKYSLIFIFVLGCVSLPARRHPAGSDSSEVKYDLQVSGRAPADLALFHKTMTEGIAFFEKNVAPLKGKIKISINGPACLTIGYSFKKQAIDFCNDGDIISAGLLSQDIIRHELFHAMVCNVRPDVCVPQAAGEEGETLAIHEGLADFFAYLLEPRDCFGKNFKVGESCLRNYFSEVCYSLTVGSHRRGSILSGEVIDSGVGLERLRTFLLKGDFTSVNLLKAIGAAQVGCFDPQNPPRLAMETTNYPFSRLNKYRINPGTPLKIVIKPNAAFTTLFKNPKVVWRRVGATEQPLFQVTAEGPWVFSVDSQATRASEKYLVDLINEDKLIASYNFYFGLKF